MHLRVPRATPRLPPLPLPFPLSLALPCTRLSAIRFGGCWWAELIGLPWEPGPCPEACPPCWEGSRRPAQCCSTASRDWALGGGGVRPITGLALRPVDMREGS